MATIKRTG